MKKFDVILLTDMTEYSMPIKTIGTYKIANVLRQKGYSVTIMDNFIWLLTNYKDEVFKWLDDRIGDNTLFVGFGTTFMSAFNITNYNATLRLNLNINVSRYDAVDGFSDLMLKLKNYNTKVVIGGQGTQTGNIFRIFNKEIDYWIRGLAEDTVVDFINNLKSGKKMPKVINSTNLPTVYDFHNAKPTFSLEDNLVWGEVLPIEISRGCRFACKFCSYPLLGRKVTDKYIRSEESLYREFKWNYDNWGTTQYQIMCDTFNESTEKLKTVQRALKRAKLDINFWVYARMDLIHAYPEQLSILRDMGIRGAFFGIESLYDPAAKAVGKGFGRVKTFKMVERMKEAWGKECLLHGAFIVGLPHETPQTATDWINLLVNRELKIDSVSINPLRIAPKEGIPTSRFYTSEFDRNAELYGYKRLGKLNWESKHWTYSSATVFVNKAIQKINAHAPSTLTNTLRSANYPMALQNGGFTWEEIIDCNDDEVFIKKVKHRKNKVLERYKELVL